MAHTNRIFVGRPPRTGSLEDGFKCEIQYSDTNAFHKGHGEVNLSGNYEPFFRFLFSNLAFIL